MEQSIQSPSDRPQSVPQVSAQALLASQLASKPIRSKHQNQPVVKRAWPIVIGIISLCLSALLGLFAIVKTVSAILLVNNNPFVQAMVNGSPNLAVWWPIISSAIMIIAYACLAFGGVYMLVRRRVSAALHMTYAMLSIGVSAINFLIILLSVGGMLSAGVSVALIIAFAGLLLGAAYPVFLMVWLFRAKVRRHIGTWKR